MLPQVIVISVPQINFSALNLVKGSFADFLLHIEKIKTGDKNLPLNALREINLTPISFTFFCICIKETSFELIQNIMNLRYMILETDKPGVVSILLSGNLEDWKYAIINGTNFRDTDVCSIFNQCLQIFEGMGLGQVWAGYAKQNYKDLVRLELKN